jgi:hypothetical protein
LVYPKYYNVKISESNGSWCGLALDIPEGTEFQFLIIVSYFHHIIFSAIHYIEFVVLTNNKNP